MTLKEAIEILELHQKWRLGEIDEMPYSPRKITEAINTVLYEVKKK